MNHDIGIMTFDRWMDDRVAEGVDFYKVNPRTWGRRCWEAGRLAERNDRQDAIIAKAKISGMLKNQK